MRLEEICGITRRVAESEGLELVHVEWGGNSRQGVLRILIDRPDGGVTHADCQNISEQVGTILDVEDIVTGQYVLEVASPGLDRRLYSPEDFERFRGRRVQVKLYRRSEELGLKKFEALLGSLEDGQVSLEVDGSPVRIAYDDIATVNLAIEN